MGQACCRRFNIIGAGARAALLRSGGRLLLARINNKEG
jgi:hypothetical protein